MLLKNPVEALAERAPAAAPSPAPERFRNAPNTDFSLERNRARMREALSNVSRELGRKYRWSSGAGGSPTGR